MSIICFAICLYVYVRLSLSLEVLIVAVKQTGDLRSHVQITECLCVTARGYLGGFQKSHGLQ